ncbi:MAG: hypothetical protein AAGI03_01350 [Pseudomonadota bacterium]
MPTLDEIPPDAWPWIDLVFNFTCVVAAIWLASTVFVIWRRSASNLTPVNSVGTRRSAQPDFLSVDEKSRREAISQGEAFDKELDKRDRDEASTLRKAARGRRSPVQRIAGLVSLFMAVFSLLSMIVSVIWQIGFMGRILEQYSAGERLVIVIQKHPIGVSVALLVIGYHVFRFFTDRKWEQEG